MESAEATKAAGPAAARGDRAATPQGIEALLEAVRHGRTPAERRTALDALLDSLLAPYMRAREPEDPLVGLFTAAEVADADDVRHRIDAHVDARERAGEPLLTEAEEEAAQSLLLARLGAL